MLAYPRLRLIAALVLGAGLAGAVAAQAQGLGFTTAVSENLVRVLASRFGEKARANVSGWQDFARTRTDRKSVV